MSCTYSKGVVFCQTDPLGALAIGLAILLAIGLAYYIGRTRYLSDKLEAQGRARIAETPDDDPRSRDE